MATSNGQQVRTVSIKGRAYVDVAERVRLAHDLGGYTMLGTETFTIEGTGRWWVRVTIGVSEARYSGTAEIKLSARAGTADGDSPYECAETSALGRALGFAGLGVLDAIASADEVSRNRVARETADTAALPARPVAPDAADCDRQRDHPGDHPGDTAMLARSQQPFSLLAK